MERAARLTSVSLGNACLSSLSAAALDPMLAPGVPVGVAGSCTLAEEFRAVAVAGRSLALDVLNDIVHHDLDLLRSQETRRLGRRILAEILQGYAAEALVVVVGGPVVTRHRGRGPAAMHDLDDLLAIELRIAQRQRAPAISSASC